MYPRRLSSIVTVSGDSRLLDANHLLVQEHFAKAGEHRQHRVVRVRESNEEAGRKVLADRPPRYDSDQLTLMDERITVGDPLELAEKVRGEQDGRPPLP